MTITVLTFLAAIVSNFNTLPTNNARALDVWALRHIHAPMSACQADWDGYAPTLQEYDVFLASCTQLNSPVLTSSDINTVLNDLPLDCYPPGPSGCVEHAQAGATRSTLRRAPAGQAG